MASSSSHSFSYFPKPHKNPLNAGDDVYQETEKEKVASLLFLEEEEEEERDSLPLELSLGGCFGSTPSKKLVTPSTPFTSTTTSSYSSCQPKKQQMELGLGLGLGFGCNGSSSSIKNFVPPPQDFSVPSTSSSSLHIGADLRLHYPFRPQCGLWFTLRSSITRDGEVGLPQIPKTYIRVKDEKVTVFMVKRYLVTKLGLSNEAEIDILCMGQRLLNLQTLKHVQDAIWLPKLMESVNSRAIFIPISDSTSFIMSLDYGRRYMLSQFQI